MLNGLTVVAPKVSVLIPTYNYARFLDDSIQTVLAQTFTNFELVIVDNCSTDDTVKVVEKYLSDKRVKFFRNETNIGLVGNWNKCFDHASGEYIKFLCADDKFHPQLLEKFVSVLDNFDNVSLVTSYSEKFGDYTEVRKTPYVGYINGKQVKEDLLNDRIYNWIGEPTTVMFRRTDLKIGRFNPALRVTIDLEFWLRLLNLGDCYVIPEVLSYFRIHGETVTAKAKSTDHLFAFEGYQMILCIKETTADASPQIENRIKELIKIRAAGCAAIVYKVLPRLHKKENRKLFRKAFKIAKTEGVLLEPIYKFFN